MRSGPYRLFFYSNEGNEPRHVHVQRERRLAKFWLDPVKLVSSNGFGPAEQGRIQRIVEAGAPELKKAWDEYFEE
jgi:hypothetical protein